MQMSHYLIKYVLICIHLHNENLNIGYNQVHKTLVSFCRHSRGKGIRERMLDKSFYCLKKFTS